jgi:hypothetical protein
MRHAPWRSLTSGRIANAYAFIPLNRAAPIAHASNTRVRYRLHGQYTFHGGQMNYKTQVKVRDQWTDNDIVFETETEAHNYGGWFIRRYRAAEDFRTLATRALVTHTFKANKLEAIK